MRAVLQVFENYQKARVSFVQTVAELATRPQNIEALQNAGVMALLRPLLLDNVPSIQQSAALALGRLANYNDELAEAVVSNEVLPQLVYSLSEQNRFYKKAAAFVLRAVAKHSPQLAQAVVDSGALDALVGCLEEFDPGVKEAAAWALGYIARHNGDLAQTVVDAGAVPLLVLCIQEPELTLKRIAASALSDISKHSPELAQSVVDGGAVAYLAPLILSPDGKLKRQVRPPRAAVVPAPPPTLPHTAPRRLLTPPPARAQVCSCLSQITKHSVDLAEVVVEAEVFPQILNLLKDVDHYVRKNAATCIREVAKHTPELAQVRRTTPYRALPSYQPRPSRRAPRAPPALRPRPGAPPPDHPAAPTPLTPHTPTLHTHTHAHARTRTHKHTAPPSALTPSPAARSSWSTRAASARWSTTSPRCAATCACRAS